MISRSKVALVIGGIGVSTVRRLLAEKAAAVLTDIDHSRNGGEHAVAVPGSASSGWSPARDVVGKRA